MMIIFQMQENYNSSYKDTPVESSFSHVLILFDIVLIHTILVS